MIILQIFAFSAAMLLGILVVFSHDPLRQTIVNGVFGLALVVLFVVLQAPDVALSELVVGTVASPLVLLATIACTKDTERPQ